MPETTNYHNNKTMKKFTLAALMLAAVMSFTACGNSIPKANLKNDIDTLSYTMGLSQTVGLREYLERGLGVDTAYMDEFIKGLNEGANAGDDKKKAAYYAGIQIGQQISNQMMKGINHQVFGNDSTKSISLKNFMAGFISGATGKKALFSIDTAQVMTRVKMEQIKSKILIKEFGANKTAGEKYLASYAKQAGVKKLEGGVLYKVIKEGEGKVAADTSLVKLNYEGKTIDGKVFDSSYERKQPADMRPNTVIKGFKTVLTNMPEGSVWEVVIPQEQAYGANDQFPNIKPFSALIFKIELLKVN